MGYAERGSIGAGLNVTGGVPSWTPQKSLSTGASFQHSGDLHFLNWSDCISRTSGVVGGVALLALLPTTLTLLSRLPNTDTLSTLLIIGSASSATFVAGACAGGCSRCRWGSKGLIFVLVSHDPVVVSKLSLGLRNRVCFRCRWRPRSSSVAGAT